MQFKDLIDQERAARTIRGYGDQLPHAFLVTGPLNVSLLPFGLAMAQWIMCEGEKVEDSCGTCSACKKMAKLIHPDFHLTFPFSGAKQKSNTWINEFRSAIMEGPYFSLEAWMARAGMEGKKPNITAEECLQILKGLSLRSNEGGPKIHMIWHAEYLGKEGNRLLKLIEEPPPNTYLILLSHSTERVLPTILSRCQLIGLDVLDPDLLEEKLESEKGLDRERARELIVLAAGDYSKALEMADKGADTSSDTWLEWMRVAFQGHGGQMVDFAQKLHRMKREEQRMLLRFGGYYLSEVLRLKHGIETGIRLNRDQKEAAQKLGAFVSVESLAELAKLLEDYTYYIDRSVSAKIMFMDLSLRMRKILTSDYYSKEQNN